MNEYMENNWKNNEIYEVFKNSLIGPLKTDIFRYCILFDKGGYYFDISRSCKIPLNNNFTFLPSKSTISTLTLFFLFNSK